MSAIKALDAEQLQLYAKERSAAPRSGVEATTVEMASVFSLNPLVRKNEPLLMVAHDAEERVEGFIVNQPILFRVGDEIRQVRWLAAAFLRPDRRGSGLFGALESQYTRGEENCVTGGSSPPVVAGARKLGWQQIKLPAPPVLRFARLAPTLAMRGRLGNAKVLEALSRPILAAWAFALSMAWRFAFRVERADDRLEELLPLLEDTRRDGFVRTPAQIRWMLQNPWYDAARTKDPVTLRYEFFFPDKTLRYELYAVKSRRGELRGAFILGVGDWGGTRSARCLDAGARDERLLAHLAPMAFSRAIAAGAHEFSANWSLLEKSAVGRFLLRLSKRRKEIYSFSAKDPVLRRGFEALTEARTTDGDLPHW